MCPENDHTWCMYKQGQQDYVPSNTIPHSVVHEFLLPWCEHNLFTEDVLRGVIGGHQTNSNESYHSLMWKIIHKERRMGFYELQAGVGVAIVMFNEGYRGLLNIYRHMPGLQTARAYQELDRQSVYYADRKVHPAVKIRRRLLKSAKFTRRLSLRYEKHYPQYSKGISSGLPPIAEEEENP